MNLTNYHSKLSHFIWFNNLTDNFKLWQSFHKFYFKEVRKSQHGLAFDRWKWVVRIVFVMLIFWLTKYYLLIMTNKVCVCTEKSSRGIGKMHFAETLKGLKKRSSETFLTWHITVLEPQHISFFHNIPLHPLYYS